MGRDWDRDQSRTPRGGRAQWISKTLAQLGRYKHQRPDGLEVDNQGCLTLQNLMDTWGYSNGVTEDEVVQAVQQNMVNERTGGSRFKMHQDSKTGDTVIQVHRAGGEWPSNNAKSTTWSSSSWNSGKSWNDDSQAKQEQNSWSSNQWKSNGDWDNKSSNGSYGNRTESWVKIEPKTETWTSRGNSAGGWRLQGSQDNTSSQGWKNQNKGGGHTHDVTEQIQRYMGYLLKNGGKEGVHADWAGYASLSSMVEAMQNWKPDFGINDVESLKRFLQETDHEGRFTVDKQDRVRKVDRNARNGGQGSWTNNSAGQDRRPTQPTQREPVRFNAFTPAYAPMSKEEAVDYGGDDDANTPGVSTVKTEQHDNGENHARDRDDGKKPKNPPGKHWIQYDDNNTIWWYYEGPKGTWWMGPEHSEPQPYSGAPVDA